MSAPPAKPPQLPFLAAIRDRGNAPPSAGDATKQNAPSTSAAPRKSASSAAKKPPPVPMVKKPLPASPEEPQGPTPSAAAMMAALKGGLPKLKKAGGAAAAAAGSMQRLPSKKPSAVVSPAPSKPSPRVLPAEREKMIQSPSSLKTITVASTPSRQQQPEEKLPGSPGLPSTATTTASISSPQPSRMFLGSPPSATTTSPPPAKSQAGYKLHKSGKYQVIMDPIKVTQAFQQLTCRYG